MKMLTNLNYSCICRTICYAHSKNDKERGIMLYINVEERQNLK